MAPGVSVGDPSGATTSFAVSYWYVPTLIEWVIVIGILAGGALLFQAAWWPQMTVVAASASLLLVALFPGAIVGPWIVAPIAINVALIAGVWLSWPESLLTG